MANYFPKQSSSSILQKNNVNFSGNASSTPSTTKFTSQTRQVRVASTLSCWFTVADSTAPSATANTDLFVAANSFPEYIGVNPGQFYAVISTSTSTGYFSLTEMT